MAEINLNSLHIHYDTKTTLIPGEQKAILDRWEKDPEKAAEVLRFLATQLDEGILRAGFGYYVSLVLMGDDDKPIFIGK